MISKCSTQALRCIAATSCFLLLSTSCGGGGNEADRIGVAATCTKTPDCPDVELDGELVQLSCLTQFEAGYCAIRDCTSETDCPAGATCVAHDDGSNYCFRECRNKAECNANRPAESEANCSANFDYADPADETDAQKACIPPSSG